MKLFRLLSAAAFVAGTTVVAFGQNWSQPWYVTSSTGATGPSTIESRVFDCYPTKLPKIAVVDDFIGNGKVTNKVVWWGTPSDYHQNAYPFLVTFYKDMPGACQPDLNTFIFQCMVPGKATAIGADCVGRKIFKYNAIMPFGIHFASGQKYWIQISEIDNKSLKVGAVDFKWAFHKRSPNYRSWGTCPALGFDPSLTFFPVFDPCDNTDIDMAFELWS